MTWKEYSRRQRNLDLINFTGRSVLIQIIILPLAIAFLIFAVYSIIIFKELLKNADNQNGTFDIYSKISQYTIGIATLISGVITTLFIFYSFIHNNRRNTKQLFETKFFDLIKIHIENVNQLAYKASKNRYVFKEMHEEMVFISNHLNRKFPGLEVTDRIVITYLTIFFGMQNSLEDLKRYLFRYYSHLGITIDEISNELTQLHSSINSYDSVSPLKGKFEGFQSILTHYFRHLYQAVKFVDERDFLTFDEKYSFVKTLRAQLSNYELAIFFFNSLSPLGKDWALHTKNQHMGLVSKYQLVKNMPSSLAMGVKVQSVYPIVEFDSEL